MHRTRWYQIAAVAILLSTALGPSLPVTVAQTTSDVTPLFANGFESDLSNWKVCGGSVGLADTTTDGPNAVHSGRYALRLTPGSAANCPQPRDGAFSNQGRTPGAAWHAVTFPANLTALTLSFWYKSAGSAGVVDVQIANTLYREDLFLGGSSVGVQISQQMRLPLNGLPGWQLFRVVVAPGGVALLRGGTYNLSFTLVGDGALAVNNPPQGSMLIDDVQLDPVVVQTTPAPRPADLRADGSAPIAFVGLEPLLPGQSQSQQHLYRMDADGSNRRRVFSGQLNSVQAAAWAPDGSRIAISEDRFTQPSPGDSRSVHTSQVSVVPADGSGQRVLMQTAGALGSRCPWNPGVDPAEQPSLQTTVRSLGWSPDSRQVAATYTAVQFYCPGDGLPVTVSSINLRNADGSGAVTTPVQNGGSSDWNRAGAMLFDVQDSFQGMLAPSAPRRHGLWEREWSAQPPTETLVRPVANMGDFLSAEAADLYPRWSPDGRHFAVIRRTASGQLDSQGNFLRNNRAIMLYDRADTANPRMLLLADNGLIDDSRLTWSPDGNFILYTFTTTGAADGSFVKDYGQYDVWWLDVRTGATGPLTSGGGQILPDWRWAAGSAPTTKRWLPLTRR